MYCCVLLYFTQTHKILIGKKYCLTSFYWRKTQKNDVIFVRFNYIQYCIQCGIISIVQNYFALKYHALV